MTPKQAKALINQVRNEAISQMRKSYPTGKMPKYDDSILWKTKYAKRAFSKFHTSPEQFKHALEVYRDARNGVVKQGVSQFVDTAKEEIRNNVSTVKDIASEVSKAGSIPGAVAATVQSVDWKTQLRSSMNRTRSYFEGIAKTLFPSLFI